MQNPLSPNLGNRRSFLKKAAIGAGVAYGLGVGVQKASASIWNSPNQSDCKDAAYAFAGDYILNDDSKLTAAISGFNTRWSHRAAPEWVDCTKAINDWAGTFPAASIAAAGFADAKQAVIAECCM
jgi:hypothetical protein